MMNISQKGLTPRRYWGQWQEVSSGEVYVSVEVDTQQCQCLIVTVQLQQLFMKWKYCFVSVRSCFTHRRLFDLAIVLFLKDSHHISRLTHIRSHRETFTSLTMQYKSRTGSSVTIGDNLNFHVKKSCGEPRSPTVMCSLWFSILTVRHSAYSNLPRNNLPATSYKSSDWLIFFPPTWLVYQ